MKLHQQVKVNELRAAELNRRCDYMAAYLSSSKFAGFHPEDGSPNDTVNVREILQFLREVRSVVDGVEDDLLVQESGLVL